MLLGTRKATVLYAPVAAVESGWTPAELFASSEEGAWYEPSPTTCFTDAGTTPAGVGDAVYQMNDLSGNGNHAIQTTAASRPTLRQTGGGLYYLEFDGTADYLDSGITFQGETEAEFIAGIETPDVTSTQLAIGQFNNSGAGNFNFSYPAYFASSNLISRAAWGTTQGGTTGLAASNDTAYLTRFRWKQNGTPAQVAYVDGTQIQSGNDGDENTYGLGLTHYIGARNNNDSADLFLSGRVYCCFMRNLQMSAQEISDAEAYFADLTGVTL